MNEPVGDAERDLSADGAEGSIAAALRARLPSLPPSERRAAQTLLTNYPLNGLETAAEFAARAGVSA